MEKTLREAAWAVYRAENYLNDIAEDETADFSNRHDALIEAWKDLRAALDREADDGWISVNVRKPEPADVVCIALRDGDVTFGYWSQWTAGWHKDGGMAMVDVTHWQPLPERPKSRENKP